MVGPKDDYASMREVIRRRYGRVQRDGLTPPDLIVIDGQSGPNIAKQVIQEELRLGAEQRMISTKPMNYSLETRLR